MKKIFWLILLISIAIPSAAFSQSYNRCKSVNLPIPNSNTTGISDTFIVSGLPNAVLIYRVHIKIDTLLHTWVGDLTMRLTRGSTSVTFCRSPGGGINGSPGDNFIGTVFSDSARYNIDSITNLPGNGQLSPPYKGYFRGNNNQPGAPTSTAYLGAFFGITNPNGIWTLTIIDSTGIDIGTLRSYCLIIDWTYFDGINQIGTQIPAKYYIEQNYPNPFNPTTNIKFGLPKSGNLKLVVLDILGKEVVTLADEYYNAGEYSADFNASNLSSGVYFYRIEAEEFNETKKMLLVK